MAKYWGRRGAGVLFRARSTGRVLFPLRSGEVNEPGTWGTWGGAMEPGEKPLDAALREAREEGAGEDVRPKDVVPLCVFSDTDAGFEYHNFLAWVDEEFEPELNWESDDFAWVEPGEWPEPLHPGAKMLLSEPASAKILMEPLRRRNAITPRSQTAEPTGNIYRSVSPGEYVDIVLTGKIVGKGNVFSGDRRSDMVFFATVVDRNLIAQGADVWRYAQMLPAAQRYPVGSRRKLAAIDKLTKEHSAARKTVGVGGFLIEIDGTKVPGGTVYTKPDSFHSGTEVGFSRADGVPFNADTVVRVTPIGPSTKEDGAYVAPVAMEWSAITGAELGSKKGVEFLQLAAKAALIKLPSRKPLSTKTKHRKTNPRTELPAVPATIEDVATAAVGSILTTGDRWTAWRRIGPRKTEWQKVRPSTHPSSDGYVFTEDEKLDAVGLLRQFQKITNLLRHEQMYLLAGGDTQTSTRWKRV